MLPLLTNEKVVPEGRRLKVVSEGRSAASLAEEKVYRKRRSPKIDFSILGAHSEGTF